MVSNRKLIKLAKKWQKLAAAKRKRISFPKTSGNIDSECCDTSSSSTVEKGHFVVYSSDKIRFVIPLKYLKNRVIRELFEIAEEEFGLPSSAAITLPCDSTFMEYVISLIQKHPTKDLEKASIMFIAPRRCSPCSKLNNHEERNQQSLICSF